MKPRACTAATVTNIPLLQHQLVPPTSSTRCLLLWVTPQKVPMMAQSHLPSHTPAQPWTRKFFHSLPRSQKSLVPGGANSSSPTPKPRHTWADGHGHSNTLKPHRAHSPTQHNEFARDQPSTHLLEGVRVSVPPLHPGAPQAPREGGAGGK